MGYLVMTLLQIY